MRAKALAVVAAAVLGGVAAFAATGSHASRAAFPSPFGSLLAATMQAANSHAAR